MGNIALCKPRIEINYVPKYNNGEITDIVTKHYLNKVLHRNNDLPAIHTVSGNLQEWWVNGKQHRDGDKPAVIERNGRLYKNGDHILLTRYEYCDNIDLNAVKYEGEFQEWWVNGKLHRDNDKPALVYVNNDCNYDNYDRDEFDSLDDYGITSYVKEYRAWLVNGKLHRDNDKPAVVIIYKNGFKLNEWWVNGNRHRDLLPAVVHMLSDGTIYKKEWWVYGNKTSENIAKHCYERIIGKRIDANGPVDNPVEVVPFSVDTDIPLASAVPILYC